MKTFDMCFKFILGDDDTYLSGSDKLIVGEWIKNNYHIYGDLSISDDLGVDCTGTVIVKNNVIGSLTNGLFRWGKIDIDFYCSCCNITSLEGAPEEVGKMFRCSFCDRLKTLEGAPEKVGGSFDCNCCSRLESLNGAPKEVGGFFDCSRCIGLESLKGAPEKTSLGFFCSVCDNLK